MCLTTNSILKDKNIFLLLFLCLFFYLIAPITQVADSNYSMMVTQAIIDHGTVRLDRYKIDKYEQLQSDGTVDASYPYQIEEHKGKLYYYFPNGTSILSTPFVAIFNIFGLSAVNSDGKYNFIGEEKIEKTLASFLMAIAAVLFYLTGRVSLNKRHSLAIALTGALATPLLSTASRGMWAHTWLVLLLSSILFLTWRGIRENKAPNPALLATLVAWMYFVRPTASISIVTVSAIVLVYFRHQFIIYCLTGLGWLAGFLLYSRYHFDTFLPSYYAASRIGSKTFFIALAGNVISPARGLLVFTPFIISIIWALLSFNRNVQEKRIVFISLFTILLHWIVVSLFPHWWGGHSYGPRFMTDVIPWFVLLAIIALQAVCAKGFAKTQSPTESIFKVRAYLFCALFLVTISFFMHSQGAFNHQTSLWNVQPNNIDQHSERIWDWRHPQFLAGLFSPRTHQDFPQFVSGKPIYLNTSEAETFLDHGWSGPEPNFRWTEKKNADFGFKAQEGKSIAIALKLAPFVAKGHDCQRLLIRANGEFVAEFLLMEQPLSEIRFIIPGSFIKNINLITFHLPDSIPPKALKISEDPRTLGVAIHSITISEL